MWRLSFPIALMPNSIFCHLSLEPTSATDTLNLDFTLSIMLLTTFRFPLRDRFSGKQNSILRVPTTIIRFERRNYSGYLGRRLKTVNKGLNMVHMGIL